MPNITTTTDENGNKVLDIGMGNDTEVTLATANTYVDKNIIIRINSSAAVDVATTAETLNYLSITLPDLATEEF